MYKLLNGLFGLILLCGSIHGQEELLVIGRTTGEITIDNKRLNVFGFTNTLSGQVTLPGVKLEANVGDSMVIDFWNISQGDPHIISINGIDMERVDDEVPNTEPVYHMDHAYYHINTDKPGSYLYYNPFNYPFNLQAGMFGVMIINPSDNTMNDEANISDNIWCSFEVDTLWHKAEILEKEKGVDGKFVMKYDPQYFLINSLPIHEIEVNGLEGEDVVILRLLNAGQYINEIIFPDQFDVKQLYENKEVSFNTDGYNKVILNSMESIDLKIEHHDHNNNDLKIQYNFINPDSQKIEFTDLIKWNE